MKKYIPSLVGFALSFFIGFSVVHAVGLPAAHVVISDSANHVKSVPSQVVPVATSSAPVVSDTSTHSLDISTPVSTVTPATSKVGCQ